MTRFLAMALSLCALVAPLHAQQTDTRFDRRARVHDYGVALIDPYAWASVAASTLIDEIGDNPDTWDFGDRALSNAGRFVLETSMYHGVAAMQDRSTWYYPCKCTGTAERAVHAFGEAFTDHDRAGATYVSVAQIGSTYGAAFIEALWRPDRSVGQAFRAGTTSLLFSGLFNIVREFLPSEHNTQADQGKQ